MLEQFYHNKTSFQNQDYSSPKQSRVKYYLKRIIEVIVIAFISFVSAYVIVNWPALWLKLKYNYEIKNPEKAAEIEKKGKLPVIPDIEREGSWLIIPKINVDAPIIWLKTVDEQTMLAELEKGVVHYANTSKPGEGGNCAITGHSSNYWWSQGKYNTVFALLDKLTNGDKAIILKDGKKYVYEMTGNEIVSPNQVSVLDPTKEPTLTLITCYPVGTNLNRLVVRLKQIEPKPKNNKKTKTKNSNKSKTLPGVR